MRSLAELKARLGKGRRCFAFFHPCLPEEPLVFVHVALLPEVAASMTDIVNVGAGREEEHECKENEVMWDKDDGWRTGRAWKEGVRTLAFYEIPYAVGARRYSEDRGRSSSRPQVVFFVCF